MYLCTRTDWTIREFVPSTAWCSKHAYSCGNYVSRNYAHDRGR